MVTEGSLNKREASHSTSSSKSNKLMNFISENFRQKDDGKLFHALVKKCFDQWKREKHITFSELESGTIAFDLFGMKAESQR